MPFSVFIYIFLHLPFHFFKSRLLHTTLNGTNHKSKYFSSLHVSIPAPLQRSNNWMYVCIFSSWSIHQRRLDFDQNRKPNSYLYTSPRTVLQEQTTTNFDKGRCVTLLFWFNKTTIKVQQNRSDTERGRRNDGGRSGSLDKISRKPSSLHETCYS